MIDKPSIVEVIAERVELRKSGREHLGLCPFHSEKTPSFTVNEDKGVFHCHGCHVGGDVIAFIMKIDGLSFPEACKALGIENASGKRPAPILTTKRKHASELAAAWVNDQRAKFNVLIAVALEQRDLADEIGDFELAEDFDRELIVLRAFYDSLEYPRSAAELLAVRESMEQITADAEVAR